MKGFLPDDLFEGKMEFSPEEKFSSILAFKRYKEKTPSQNEIEEIPQLLRELERNGTEIFKIVTEQTLTCERIYEGMFQIFQGTPEMSK